MKVEAKMKEPGIEIYPGAECEIYNCSACDCGGYCDGCLEWKAGIEIQKALLATGEQQREIRK